MTSLLPACERIDDYLARRMAYHGVPGAIWAVTDRERTLHLTTWGVANLDSGEPVAPGQLFMLGSIGKSFTAIALLQLCEEGRLELDAPVTEYLPWFEVGGEFGAPTIHHLLTHTGGIIGVNDVLTDKLFDVWALRDSPAAWAPGSRYYYSNVGYKTLGLVLERVAGARYGEIIRSRILDPLGMTATDPETTHQTRRRLATGYLHFYDDRPWLPRHGMAPAAWLEIASGDGCICAPLEDLATYLRALLNRDARLLTSASFDLLTGRHVEVEPNHWYGYGLDIDEVDGHVVISHGGEMPGYQSYMLADRDTGLGFCLLLTGLAPVFSLSMFAQRALAAAAAGQPPPELPELPDRRAIADPALYAGDYAGLTGERPPFTLASDGERLSFERDGGRYEVWQAEDGGIVIDHPEFDRLPLHVRATPGGGRVARHGEDRYIIDGATEAAAESPASHDERGDVTGHYRSYGSVWTNFRICTGWDGELLLVHQSGKEERLHRLDPATWRVEGTPETLRFDTFVEGRALRATFSGCDFYRTFTP